MSKISIFEEISKELDYQERRWGHVTDDTLNSPNDWAAYIAHHSTRWFNGGFPPYPEDTVRSFRSQMVKVAALAVAAIESLDRQIIPFYQKVI